MTWTAQAPAKINRELRVGPRRPDGYHEILSRFVSIDLCDTIEVSAAAELSLTVSGSDISAGEDNLVMRAARLLGARLSVEPAARIVLRKNIPTGAGLGGGSADAAVTLLLLRRLWRREVPPRDLAAIAAELGSDVPFFLAGGEADVGGRGENVSLREDAPPEDLTLLIPPFPLSTSDVYAAYDATFRDGKVLPGELEIVSSGRFFGPNDLASAVLVTHAEMRMYLQAARETSSDQGMSGSGSAIALKGAEPRVVRDLEARLPGCRFVTCRTMGREEYRRRIQPTGGSSWTSHR